MNYHVYDYASSDDGDSYKGTITVTTPTQKQKQNPDPDTINNPNPITPITKSLFNYTKQDIEQIVKEKNKTEYLNRHIEEIKNKFEIFLREPSEFYMFKVVKKSEYGSIIYSSETFNNVKEYSSDKRYKGHIPSNQLKEGIYYQIPIYCDNLLITSALEPFKHMVSYCDTSGGKCYCLYVRAIQYD